ncbi:MAG TPA: NERD domain-containing protein [Bacillaceae bacterium]
MAQLIKLQDYISRYELDISRYPSQFVRLKKQHWEQWKSAWETGGESDIGVMESISEEIIPEKPRLFGKLKGMFKKEEETVQEPILYEANQRSEMDFPLEHLRQAENEEELKQMFLDKVLHFQIKWASSTITDKSFVDSKYYKDNRLRYLLQRFPDTFLVLYQPVFLLKKAPVELEVMLLTPTGIWCLVFLEEEDHAAFSGSADHFWLKKIRETEKKVLNPILAAGRMEKIVKQLFYLYEVDLPIQTAVISRNGYIDYPDPPGNLVLLDRRSYEGWFQKMRAFSSPMKSMQIRAAKALLEYCQTTCYRRPEWEQEKQAGHDE